MNIRKLQEWIVNHATGISSLTMWAGLMEITPDPESYSRRFDVPYDADDFSRCYDLVKFCDVEPEKDFPKILVKFPFYAPIVRNWDKLCKLYESENFRDIYYLLDSLMPEVKFLRKQARR